MNRHELLDVAPLALGGAILPESRKLFARRLDSPPYSDHLDGVSIDLPAIDGPTKRDLQVDSLVGRVDAGVWVARWLGPDHPTVIYHHGNREQPFPSSRLSNSFKRVLLDADRPIRANLIAVRAPFHTLGIRAYIDRLTAVANFVAMLAVSTRLVEELIAALPDSERVVVSGLSLGGFVTNLHRTFFDSADVYVPMLAGTLFSDLVTEAAYRHVTAERAKERPERVRELLDFEEAFAESNGEVRPLLGRHDAIVRYEPQRRAYGELPVRTVEKGHTTTALASEMLCEHVRSAL